MTLPSWLVPPKPVALRTYLAQQQARLACVALGVLSVPLGSLRAQVQGEVPKARIPDHVFSIVDYGAKAGAPDNGLAVQKAIDAAAAKGGGRVVVPAGEFVIGPISLRSQVDLHLEKEAKLLMSLRFDDFPVRSGNRRVNLIDGADLHDVRISGEGVIDGRGDTWWQAYRLTKGDRAEPGRPQMIGLSKCERVELDGFSTLNPPNTHCSIHGSKDITINHLTMSAPSDSPNTDALNLNAVENVLITNCDIRTGDDNIVLLGSGNNSPTNPGVKNITIRDCKLGAGHGLSIGSYTSSGVQNVRAENIAFDGTTSGIRLKAARDRGGLVKGLSYKHITMNNVRYPISITSYYPRTPKGPAEDEPKKGQGQLPDWTDITIEDVTISNSKNSISLWGLPDKHIQGVTLKNITAGAESGAVVFHADVTFENVAVKPAEGPALQTFDATVKGMAGVPFSGDYKAR